MHMGHGTTRHCTNLQSTTWPLNFKYFLHANVATTWLLHSSFNFCLKWWNSLALHLAERGGNVILSNPRELQSCTWSIKCTAHAQMGVAGQRSMGVVKCPWNWVLKVGNYDRPYPKPAVRFDCKGCTFTLHKKNGCSLFPLLVATIQ
jgi:hypothetical protein